MDTQICNICHFPLAENFYFCPNCGKKIKNVPLSLSIGKQIGIYALSALLPPLGLWPGIKYMREKDTKAKSIGMIAIILTIISTVLTIWVTMKLITQVNIMLNTQMKQYQNLEF